MNKIIRRVILLGIVIASVAAGVAVTGLNNKPASPLQWEDAAVWL